MNHTTSFSVPANLLFWKWSDGDLEPGAVLEQIDDLCRRSAFEIVGVGLEHTKSSFDSDRAHAAIAAASARLAEHGRHLVLSIDPRQEPDWARDNPDHCLAWVDSWHTSLNEPDGSTWTSEPALMNDHFGVHPVVRSEVLAAFAYEESDPRRGPVRFDDAVEVAEARAGKLVARVPYRPGWRVLVLVAHWLSYPDVFHDAVFRRHEQLLRRYADVPLAGAAIDEWGTVPQPGFRFGRAWATPWWSAGLAASYSAATGRDLLSDLFRQQVGGTDDAGQTAAIVDYFRVVRDRTADFERLHYDATKSTFGSGAYVGFHPTWYAVDETNQSWELFKNGFNWWAVHRDIGQTDEVAPMGVRLALARKAGRPQFFNMWYGMGTNDVATFVQDAWRNARYGGRTNHLGYRCEAERWAVTELADGGLEDVSAMEERITRMASHVHALVDSPVLVVVGWDAAVDWRRHVRDDGLWAFADDTLTTAYAVLRSAWDAGYIAELVPDYEDLTVEGGRVVWCGHAYDAALYVDATPPVDAATAIAMPAAAGVADALDRLGARRNDVPWGCRLEDGTVLVAAPGEALDPIVDVVRHDGHQATNTQATTSLTPTGNAIDVEVQVGGHTVSVQAEDYVVIAPDLGSVVAGALHRVLVDGADVTDRY
jgi:hypothetical protein